MLSVGPDWLRILLQALVPTATILDRYQNAFNRVEVSTFLTFAASPHLALALAILLYVLTALYQFWHGDRRLPMWKLLILCVLSSLNLGLLNPFSLPTLLLPIGVWWLVRSVWARRILWKEALPIIALGVTSLPLVFYNAWTFSQDPFWGIAYGSQNYQISYPLDVVLIGYGVVSLLAIIGTLRSWRHKLPVRFLAFWGVVVWLIGYIPVDYQRRFSFGLAPVLAILAVDGWRQIA